MRRGVLLGGVALLSVGFMVWGFARSSFSTGAAVTGALGAVLLGLAVFMRVRRGAARRGVPAIVLTQFLYLALWIAGGLLWAGPPRELPHFAVPVGLSLEELQGQWTGEDGQVYEVRGEWFCPPSELPPRGQPSPHICSSLEDEQGRLTFFVDDQGVPATTYRRWGREVLAVEWVGLTFSRPIPSH